MKKSILLFILVSLFTCAFAVKPVVTVNEAKQTAANFLTEQCYIKAASIHLTLQHTETDENGDPLYYRFRLNNRGFVIVSATELYYPVLAFSYESDYAPCPENDAFCASYKKNIKDAKFENKPVSVKATEAWAHYNKANFSKSKSDSVSECQPFLTTQWGQKKYYNQYCPFDGNANENDKDLHTVVGSMALAMATVINYYRYPTQGYGGVSYISVNGVESYPRIFLNLNEVTYNYDAMTSSLDNYNGEVAKLLFHTGATAQTNYSAERSTADKTKTDPVNAFNALKQYWGMTNDAVQKVRDDIDSIHWITDYVLPDLDEKRPVIYSAYKAADRKDHLCFVIDGYKYLPSSQGSGHDVYLHVNSNPSSAVGMKKGFYMYPSGSFSYRIGESVIRLLHPDEINIEKPIASETINTATAGTVCDGAGNMLYASNSNRQWLIQTPNATGYDFTFKRLNTEENNDVITVYSGTTADPANLKYTFSGQHLTVDAGDVTQGSSISVEYDMDPLPASFSIESESVLITFTSNDTIEDYGFVLEYKARYNQPVSCENANFVGKQHYVITDTTTTSVVNAFDIESSEDLYAPNKVCSWIVSDPAILSYHFDFSKFDLKAGDFVEIVSTSTIPELLYRFDVFNWPQPGGYDVDATEMKVRFVTDHWMEGEGFELEYWAILGINQESGLSDIRIYPNPATNFLNVELNADAQNIKADIVDMSGKVLYQDILNHNGGIQNYKIPVSNLANGIYFLHLNTPTGQSIQKFIVK
ncbi:MAG: C10 family peptidase [Bacteroidales bacterium]|nr:C10 family peptidase [Bacteroidales bacterium]